MKRIKINYFEKLYIFIFTFVILISLFGTAFAFTGIVENYEDNNINIELANWSYSGSSGDLTIDSDKPINGTYSAIFKSTSNFGIDHSSGIKPNNISIKIKIDDLESGGSQTERIQLRDKSASNSFIGIWFQEDQDILVYSNNCGSGCDTGRDWVKNTSYHVQYADLDFSNNHADVYINGEKLLEDEFFAGTGDDLERIGIHSKTPTSVNIYYDDFNINNSIDKPLDYKEATLDNFDKGKIREYDTDGWSKEWYKHKSSDPVIKSETSNPISGTTSIKLENKTQIYTQAKNNIQDDGIKNISYKIKLPNKTGSSSDHADFDIRDHSGNPAILIDFRGDGVIAATNSTSNVNPIDTGETWNESKVYRVNLTNITHNNHNYNLTINGKKVLGNANFNKTFNGYQRIRLDNDAGNGITVIYDDISVATSGNITPAGTQKNKSLEIIADRWMDYNTKQKYKVEKSNDTGTFDVSKSNNTNVTSNNTNVITVFENNITLKSTNNTSINKRIKITATFKSLNDTINITVANRTLENIHIMPPEQFIPSLVSTDEGIGEPVFHWIFILYMIALTFTIITKNKWVGIGIMEIGAVLFFIANFITVWILIPIVFFGIYLSMSLLENETISANT